MPIWPTDYIDKIITGDARELAREIPDESVDLILCDPPFGIDYDYGKDGYQDESSVYLDLVRWLSTEAHRIIKPGCFCFVFQAMSRLKETWPLFPNSTRLFAACKNFVQMLPTPMQYAYDPVVVWQKEGQYPREAHGRDWHIGNTAQTTSRGNNEAGWHTCPRPLDTIEYMIANYCSEDGIVLDFFGGSGTTAVAAKRLGRHYVLFEIMPDIAERSRARIAGIQSPLPGIQAEQMPLEPA